MLYEYSGLLEQAILRNSHLFKGKTVMVVGCGIGLCPLLTLKAGATKVSFECVSVNLFSVVERGRLSLYLVRECAAS